MSETPPPPPAPPAAPAPKKEFLDNAAVKFVLSIMAWLAPLPVAIVMLKLYYTYFSPEAQSGMDPFQSLKHTLLAFSGMPEDLVAIASVLPSAVLLSVLYRTAAGRIGAILVLLLVGFAETMTTMDMWSGL